MCSDDYVKELRRQATSFNVLSKILRTNDPTSKELMNSAVCKGLSEVCEQLAALKEVSG